MKNGKGKIILLLIITIISITKVNALEMKTQSINANNVSGYDNTGYGNFLFQNINYKESWDKNLDFTNISVKGYDFIQFGIQMNYEQKITYNETTTDYQPVENTEYYCASWSQRQQTYADGSQSTYYVCEVWKPSSNSSYYTTSTTGSTTETPEIGVQINLIYDNNTTTSCVIEGENYEYGASIVTCKIPNNANSIKRLRFRNTGTNYINNIIGSIGIQNNATLWKDPTNVLNATIKSGNQEIINNNNQNAQNIQDGINNADYTGKTEQPDKSNYDSYQQKEQALEQMANADMSTVNIGLNANASNWIWTIINRILNANSIIMSFYITILSIGVIKLIMRR